MNFKGLIAFLKELADNNNKEWFDANRDRYEALRQDWISYAGEIIAGIGKFEPEIAGLDPRKCIFRINKDIRFSKDKTPYKTNFGAIMNRGAKKELFAGYYLHIDPKEIFIAAGAYQPEPALLAAIRQEIDYHYKEFDAIVNNKKAKELFGTLKGEQLARPPKGYDASNPALPYLKHKGFIWVQNFQVKDLMSPGFTSGILKSYSAMKPLNDFVNRCIQ